METMRSVYTDNVSKLLVKFNSASSFWFLMIKLLEKSTVTVPWLKEWHRDRDFPNIGSTKQSNTHTKQHTHTHHGGTWSTLYWTVSKVARDETMLWISNLVCLGRFLTPSVEDNRHLYQELWRRSHVIYSPTILIIYLFPIVVIGDMSVHVMLNFWMNWS